MRNSVILTIALMMPTFSVSAAADLNDEQIAAIVVAANQVDIDAGKAAESKSSNRHPRAEDLGTAYATECD
jgi:putative membrane protein